MPGQLGLMYGDAGLLAFGQFFKGALCSLRSAPQASGRSHELLYPPCTHSKRYRAWSCGIGCAMALSALLCRCTRSQRSMYHAKPPFARTASSPALRFSGGVHGWCVHAIVNRNRRRRVIFALVPAVALCRFDGRSLRPLFGGRRRRARTRRSPGAPIDGEHLRWYPNVRRTDGGAADHVCG